MEVEETNFWHYQDIQMGKSHLLVASLVQKFFQLIWKKVEFRKIVLLLHVYSLKTSVYCIRS